MRWRPTRSSALRAVLASIAALCIALLASAFILVLNGQDLAAVVDALVQGAFGGSRPAASTLSKLIPITLAATGWIVAFRVRRINIGLEGQIVAGGLVAGWVGINVEVPFGPAHLLLAVAAGILGGALYAGIAAWMWARAGASEILTTLMLNLIAIQVLAWLIRGPMQEKGSGFARSESVKDSAQWPEMFAGTALHWDVVLVASLIGLTWLLLARTTLGFRLGMIGANPEMARHMDVSPTRFGVLALLISGALAGLAGSSRILAGEVTTVSDNFSANYGYDGIVVALLARNSIPGVVPAALLIATLRQGGGALQSRAGVSSEIVLVVQGLIILAVAASVLLEHRWERRRSVAPAPDAMLQPARES